MPMVGGDQVHDGPGEDDDDALPERLRFERSLAVFGQDGVGLRLLEHLHETAEGDEPDAIFGFLAAQPEDLRPEAEREGDDLHAEDLGPGVMPELVHENQRGHENDEIKKVHRLPRFGA